MSSRIPAGTFMMGSPASEANRGVNEAQHEVTLTEDFYMSRYEITNAQYAAFLNATSVDDTGMGYVDGFSLESLVVENTQMGVTWTGTSWRASNGRAAYPIAYVSWFGAKAFADWAGMQLPTEAQWEYACRAGTTTAWYFGDDPALMGEYAWFANNSGNVLHPIGGKKPNAWGLYDIHGNVAEWCYDWYEANYLNLPVIENPTGPASGTERVGRGGSWSSAQPQQSRSACRYHYNPNSIMGFRVVFVP
jgi:formylglycine-generating enzyme required for sulfatase activity